MKHIRKFWAKYKLILLVFVVWRLFLFLVGLWAFKLYTFKASFPEIDEMLISSGFPQWFWHWGNFDGVHYLDLARNGYHGSGLQVFFPVFPFLIKLTNLFLRNYFLSGFLLANVSILLAAIIFYDKLVRLFDKKVAIWSILFLFSFPTSFFFGSIYTESPFLLFILLGFTLPNLLGIIFGALAGATRLIGSFIVPSQILGKPRNYLSIFMLAGILGYVIYLFVVFHNPLYFLSAQAAFRNERASSVATLVTPPQVIYRYLKIFATADRSHPDFWVAVLEFSAFIFGLIMLTWLSLKKKVPSSWLIFSWLSLLLPSFSGTLSSMSRYLLSIFPIFVGLSQIRNSYLKISILAGFTILLGWLTALFVRGYWIG